MEQVEQPKQQLTPPKAHLKRKSEDISPPETGHKAEAAPPTNKRGKVEVDDEGKMTITSAKVTDTHITVQLSEVGAETDSARARTVVYTFPVSPIADKIRKPSRWEILSRNQDNRTEKEEEAEDQRRLEAEYAGRFKWFVEKTTGLRVIPGLLERAKQHWDGIEHAHKYGWLGSALNLFAQCAGLTDPICRPDECTTQHHSVLSPEVSVCLMEGRGHLGGESTPLLEKDNPFHFVALLVSSSRGWWNSYFKECIVHALGPDCVNLLLEYLAHEERCDGLRWFQSGGIDAETIVADAIMFALQTCNGYYDAWAKDLDLALQARYRKNIAWERC